MNASKDNIILIGFSYTGKTEVAREVSRRLGWSFMDTDEAVTQASGRAVPAFFLQDDEAEFRKLERRVLEQACALGRTVIATGGGAVADPRIRELMAHSGVVICLEASPQTIYGRLQEHTPDNPGAVRPLLTARDPLARIRSLKAARQPFYALADWTIHTDTLTLEEVAAEVLQAWSRLKGRKGALGDRAASRLETPGGPDPPVYTVTTTTARYPLYVGWGLLEGLGQRMNEAGLQGRAFLISDDVVYPHYGDRVLESLRQAGFAAEGYVVSAGEKSKTLEMAEEIYHWLVAQRAERGHPIVALGGGVVGDLAGFVAATFLRGVPLVQVPTSLLAMVDASIGGKAAVNLPQAKNLVGAFYQPCLVLADLATLRTLPPRQLTEGWAEVIKHALILDASLFELMEQEAEALRRLEPGVTASVIGRSAAIKGEVVTLDEKETGLRTLLNYGHTIGHALEAATGYEGLLHGEAVAIGMMGAARLSQEMGLIDAALVERQRAVLQRFGLPTKAPGIDPDELAAPMALDKKVQAGSQRWVLLEDLGKATVRNDVPDGLVRRVLQELIMP